MGKTESKRFTYVNFDIKQDDEGITINQNPYAAGLKMFDIKPERAKQINDDLEPKEKKMLKDVAGRIGWLGRGTRPDILFSRVELSTKFVTGKVLDLNQAAKIIRKVKDNKCSITIKNIGDMEDWYVEVSTDVSLYNLNNGVSSTASMVI